MTLPNRFRLILALFVCLGLAGLVGGRQSVQAGPLLTPPGESPTGSPTGQTPQAAPNLRPYVPSGWSYQIVPSSVTGTHTVDTLVINAPTYLDWAVSNDGDAIARGGIYFCLSLDGTEIGRWYRYSLRPGYYTYAEDFSHTVTSAGTHNLSLTADCTGRVAESNESDNTWSMNFTWQGAGSGYGAIISNKQGFDKCEIPTTSQLQTWWDNSPYFEVNLYIGGVSRACANSGLNAAWVSAANNQGWNFIPTWVGLQAPCSGFSQRMSSDPTTAYNQGRSEAASAAAAAGNLGLTAGGAQTIIYLDMEAYPNDSGCRNAVKSFVSGWSGRLRELGHRAGVYGSACGSYVTDWAAITNVPDDIWPAHWIYSAYNAGATVWSVACVADSYWSNHQRIRQYAGGHNETYGGVTFNIDSDVLDGHVSGTHPRVLTAPTVIEALTPGLRAWRGQTANYAWVIADNRLSATMDGGRTWQDITPAGHLTAQTAFFLDERQGWVILGADQGGSSNLSLTRTDDGGRTWQALPVVTLPFDNGQAVEQATIQFVDEQTGWLAAKLATGVNFSLGLLFQTRDGGLTWTPRTLPIGAPVYFVDAMTGWVAGGARGDELYVTRDGGQTWQAVNLAQAAPAEQLFYGLPVFTGAQTAVLPVTSNGPEQTRLVWYVTRDGGLTWTPTATTVLAPLAQAAVTAVLSEREWAAATPDGVLLTRDAGRTWRLSGLADVTALGLADAQHGWAQTETNQCAGDKGAVGGEPWRCTLSTQLWRTADGGLTWEAQLP